MDSTSANENQTSSRPSPVKNVNASPQVYVITPNQLAKLGLSTQIHSLIATQVQSKQTVVERERVLLDNDGEQSLSISSSTPSHALTENKTSIETRKSVNTEENTNTSSSLRNEMKSKLHYLLNTNESFVPSPLVVENVNMSVIKDSNEIHILNYAMPTSSARFGAVHNTITDAINTKIVTAGTEMRHRTLSHDSIVKQQTVKPAPRIINSKSYTEATKTTPVKLEIVSNEVVNFSALEIQNILKQNAPAQSKATESIPQSTSNTIINKTAYLQNALCTQDGAASKVEKHFKKKLYETFHVADNAAVQKQSKDTGDKVIDLGNTPEERSDGRSQKGVESLALKLSHNTKDRNITLPPERTFVVRQAQIQILNSSQTPTEQVKFECTNEDKTVSEKLQTDTTLETENRKAAIPINNNNTELKVSENKSTPYPTLLNSLLQKRNYVGAASSINISDHTSLNVLNRGVGPNLERRQPKTELVSADHITISEHTSLNVLNRGFGPNLLTELVSAEGNNSAEGQTKEINSAPEFSERNTCTGGNSVNEQESEYSTSLPNIDSQTELVRKVERTPPPRILNLELQEKIDVSLEIEESQDKAGLESANIDDPKECLEKPTPTDTVDENSVNELDGENLTSEKALPSDDSQTVVEKTPALPPRVLNLELQERKKVITDKSSLDSTLNLELQESKKVITDKSSLDSTAANSSNQEKEKLQTEPCGEQQKSGAALSSKLHQDFFKKVNTLAAEPNLIKTQVIKEIRSKLFSVTKNENFRKDNTRCYGKNKTVNAVKSDDASVEHNSDSDKVSPDVDATAPKLKHFETINTPATLKAAEKNSDVIVIDADEITPRRNTRREQEEKTPTLKTPADVDLYVQSKTSGRKRKYVDYKLLSGIRRCSGSDSDSTDGDTPTKKSPTVTNNQDKSTADINPVKKRGRGRGRPRKSEVKPSECNKQVQLNTSDSNALDSEVEKQCDASALDKHAGRGRPRRSEIVSTESNNQVQLDTSDSDVLNSENDKKCDPSTLDKPTDRGRPKDTSDSNVLDSETEKQCDSSTLDKHAGRGRPRRSEIVSTECNKQVQIDTSDSDVLNSETDKKCDPSTLDKPTDRGRPKHFEVVSTECNEQVQLDTSDSDVLNSESDKKCDPSTLDKPTGRGREVVSTECNKQVQLDTSDGDVLSSETEKKCDPFTLEKPTTGGARPSKSEIKSFDCNKQAQPDTSDSVVLNSETDKKCDPSTLDKPTGRGRPKKFEVASIERNKQVQLDTSDGDVLNSETEKKCDPSILVKQRTGRGHPRKSEIKPDDCKPDPSDCDALNSKTEKQCDPSTPVKHTGRGRRPRKSECSKQVRLGTSDSNVLNSETDSSSPDKRPGRGRPRKSEVKPDERDERVKVDVLSSETEGQCDSSTLDKHRGRGRRRKSEIKPSNQVELHTSGGDVLNSETEKQSDFPTPDKHVGRGRPRKSDIKPNNQVKLDASGSDVLNSETEKQRDFSTLDKHIGRGRPRKSETKPNKQRDSSTLDNHSNVQPEKGNLQKSSIVTSTPEKKLRGRRGRKRKVEVSDSPIPDKSTPAVLSKSAVESEPTEKRLRSHTKIRLEKMNSAEKNSSTEKEAEHKSSTRNSNPKKDLQSKSADASEKDSKPPIVETKRRGRSKKTMEEEEPNSTNNKIDPEPDVAEKCDKSERKGRGRGRKTQELTDDKVESSKKITKNDDKIEEAKKKRGRPKKINNDNSQSPERKTELGKHTTRSESKKPKIAEVNLSEDRLSSDVDLSNSNLNTSTDPLDIESIPDDLTETGSDTNNLSYTKDPPSDTLEKKVKSTEKKRRGRSKAVVNESELKSEAETEKNPQNVNTESKPVEDTCKVEPTKELEVTVKPQKRRGRKRKVDTSEKKSDESNNVTCAVCKSVLEESQWIAHSELKHNNLAWKTNEDPLDLSDQALVQRILSDLHKSKKVLHCELCECEIQTLSGYAEHKKSCTRKPDDDEPVAKKKLISSVLDSLFSNISTPTKKEESASTESTSAKEEAAVTESNFVEEILPPLGANDVRCAVCSDVMPKGQWPSHKQRKHNNLAWKVGEKPLDLNDRSVIMRVLTDLCKSKKPLLCEVCGVGKKSVLGFLSHKSQCQKSDSEINALKVTCKLCGRSMLPVSLQRHIALTHSVNAMETDSTSSLEPLTPESDPQGKRKAANKAAGLIHSFAKDMLNEVSSAKFKKYVKNVNFRSVEAAIYKFSEDIQKQSYTECVFDECNYRTSEHEDLFYHIENCDKNSDTNYTCNFCLATFRARQNVREHIKLSHGNNENHALISQFSDGEFKSESEDDYTSDSELINAEGENLDFFGGDVTNRPRKSQQASSSGRSTSNNRVHFLQSKTKKPQSIYLNAYWWMEKFSQENYRLRNSFPRIYCKKEDWIQLDPTQIINYLPKLRHSVDTARIRINNVVNPICYEYVWKKYKLFESETLSDDGSSIFFCGGPINALAWVPTPHTESNCDQILAVSVAPGPDEKYNTNAVYKDAGLIQFWNIGVLHNRGISTYQPKLEFSIAHHYGVIWAMEWCPSGCYDLIMTEDVKRLGLLAVACSNSFVYVYLVPHPGQVSGSMFKTKPTYKLQLENFTDLAVGEIDYYSTRLSWCKTYGHQFLGVGYSNGVVAVYDLKTEATLLKTEIDGVVILQPTQKFRAHLDAITALCLYHLHDGKRWLLTGSLDRDCKLWDLENISEPINYCKKFVITDAVWLVHWLCSVYSYDHGCISGAVPTSLNPARDFFASCTTFMPSNSRVTSITANEWANLFIQANDCGEVICGFPDQLLQGYDCDKKKSLRKSRCLASYTGIVPKSIPASERIKLETVKLQSLKNQHSNTTSKNPKRQSAHPDVNNESCEARTYFEAEKKYGLVFCDLNMDYKLREPTVELDKLLQSTHYFSLAKPDMYPLQSITKVTSNPNKNSFLYYACGYQVGIVRVSNLRFLCPENEQLH